MKYVLFAMFQLDATTPSLYSLKTFALPNIVQPTLVITIFVVNVVWMHVPKNYHPHFSFMCDSVRAPKAFPSTCAGQQKL